MRKPARRQPAASTVKSEAAAVEVTGVSASAPETAEIDRVAPVGGRSRLAELRDWLKTVPDNHPYEDLVPLARRSGWDWLLRESSTSNGSNVLTVTFAVLLGRIGDEPESFEYVDNATFALPAVPGPVSAAARAQIGPTIVHMLFGRLPPAQGKPGDAPAASVETSVDLSGGDVEIDDEDEDDLPPEETVNREPWTADMVEKAPGLPNVVDHYEDGVPIFRDLDDVEAPSVDVIVAVTNAVSEGLLHVKSVEGVLNFFNSNKQVFDWLTEMALPEQRKAIVDAFNRRKGQIEGGFVDVAPRRRSVS